MTPPARLCARRCIVMLPPSRLSRLKRWSCAAFAERSTLCAALATECCCRSWRSCFPLCTPAPLLQPLPLRRQWRPPLRVAQLVPLLALLPALLLQLLVSTRCEAVLVLPRAHVPAENAKFYVFRDDIILFPISFSIPKERILSHIPEKTAFALNDSQRSFTYKNYQFGPLQEEDYHRNMQRHRFCDTRKKGGHDCLRHYEILANGCVPVLFGLEHFPQSIMTTLPRPLLWRARELFDMPWANTEGGPGEPPDAAGPRAYEELAQSLLDYTAKHLSTEATARYLLDTLNIPVEGSKVLFLPCMAIDPFPSYLASSVFHGLHSLLGDNVVDFPEYQYAYQLSDSAEEEHVKGNLWGQGYTLGFKLPRRPYLNRANISQRIRNREFDLVIFARMSPYEPCNFGYPFGEAGAAVPQFFEDVYGHFPRERVALLYGDDSGLDDAVIRTHVARMGALHRGIGFVFMRELLPFPGEGPPNEALRPVDEALLQPGCFRSEWLSFFSQWHGEDEGPTGLQDCVRWGACASPEVDLWLGSQLRAAQTPPSDRPALKQFCRTGFALKAALLVRRLGSAAACAGDEACSADCEFFMDAYSRHLIMLPSGPFFAEFGITPAEVLFVLSQGCRGGAVALQPATREDARGIAIVSQGSLPCSLSGFGNGGGRCGPYAGEFQLQYLVRQGFLLLLVSGTGGGREPSAHIERLRPRISAATLQLLGSGRVQFASLPPAAAVEIIVSGSAPAECGWYLEAAAQLHYVHFELGEESPAVIAALGCLRTTPQPPRFVSLQLPLSQAASELAAAAAESLVAVGYTRFKVTRLALGGPEDGVGGAATAIGSGSGCWLGAPIADLVGSAGAGAEWKTAVQAFGSGLWAGGQLHAALR
mmetsp:Transcript_122560/g.391818  ORF Transcript_122560/g.391818 Transcript_122560/m.391818 type:complete len:875 (-) Transcript_122560:122-2746(-)